jgi:hypothetical protein
MSPSLGLAVGLDLDLAADSAGLAGFRVVPAIGFTPGMDDGAAASTP